MLNFDDYKNGFENMFSKTSFKIDDVIKNTSEYNSKLAKIAFDAAKKNVEISQAWTKETLSSLENLAKPQTKPGSYIKITNDYITEQTQISPKYLAEFAEIAKKTQLDTIEFFMDLGKKANDDVNKSSEKKSSSTKPTSTEV